MSLTITPEMIHELHEYGQRGADAAIVLTCDGWKVRVITGNAPAGYTAMTAYDVDSWLDGGDIDDDAAAALAEGDGSADGREYYAIPTDDAGGADTRWQVVVPDDDATSDGYGSAWWDAWAFDQDTAAQLIVPGRDLEQGLAETDLWATAGGRWVIHHTDPQRDIDEWHELDDADAAKFAYDHHDAVGDDAPVLLQAAAMSRRLVELMRGPRMPIEHDPVVAKAAAYRRLDAATRTFHDVRTISDLLRATVLKDLRAERGTAARIVDRCFNTQAEAAAHVGIKQGTFNELLAS